MNEILSYRKGIEMGTDSITKRVSGLLQGGQAYTASQIAVILGIPVSPNNLKLLTGILRQLGWQKAWVNPELLVGSEKKANISAQERVFEEGDQLSDNRFKWLSGL